MGRRFSPALFYARPGGAYYFPLYLHSHCVLLYQSVSPVKPTTVPRSRHVISRKRISHNAVRVLYKLKEHGHLAYLVGGGVRDLLLGREPKDFDIATDATPGELKKVFRNCRLIGRRFRLAHIHFHDEIIEVATFRSMVSDEPEAVDANPSADKVLPEPSEQSVKKAVASPGSLRQGSGQVKGAGMLPEATVKPKPPRMLKTEGGMILRDNVFGTPEEDAIRRDFTINALFYSIADFSVIDYVGGMRDLERGRIRIIGDPMIRFTEDPVRMVRAVRFAALLGFRIEEKTERAMMELKDQVSLASPARMYEEVLKLFLLGEGEKTYQLLRKTGLFGVIFPRLNEWVDKESDGFPHVWVGKAFEWVDAYVQSGRQIPPHILFGLVFGQLIEGRAAELRKQGVPALDAMTKAVAEIMLEQAQRVQIPRKVGLAMRDMYWNQQRFDKREGKYPRYFLRRPGFSDAFEYLRFTSETTGEKKDVRLWWKEFIKTNPLSKEEKKDIQNSAEKKARPKRRRRRRGGQGKPVTQKPKT
jgi:poly(A) polymerase